MKPKTKLEKRTVELSSRLPEITDKHRNWSITLFYKHFVRTKHKIYCLECGHDWKDSSGLVSSLAGAYCPNCEAELKEVKGYKSGRTEQDYWAILDTIEGVQVVRMFIAYKHMKKNNPVHHFTTEVMQHFIFENGKACSLAKATNPTGSYYCN